MRARRAKPDVCRAQTTLIGFQTHENMTCCFLLLCERCECDAFDVALPNKLDPHLWQLLNTVALSPSNPLIDNLQGVCMLFLVEHARTGGHLTRVPSHRVAPAVVLQQSDV